MTDALADHAKHLLAHLDTLAAEIEANSAEVTRRAFPDSDPGLDPRAIVGARDMALEGVEITEAIEAVTQERRRLLEAGVSALKVLQTSGPEALDGDARRALEALMSVSRPALLMRDGAFGEPVTPWDRILDPHRRRIEKSAAAVGRIGVTRVGAPERRPPLPYEGTGFMVAKDVLMTNCHVAINFARSAGDGAWSLQPQFSAYVDFADDPDAPRTDGARPRVKIIELIGIHPTLDVALLRVEPAADGVVEPLKLMSEAPGPDEDRVVYLLGYPAEDPRNDPSMQIAVFGDRYRRKRLSPGEMVAPPENPKIRWKPCSIHTEPDQVLFHDASTLGGNSGSCVLDLDSGQVIGVHFGGSYLKYNYAVALWRLTDDPLFAGAELNWD